jgi:tetratricopeptide (TPR) repeat protein
MEKYEKAIATCDQMLGYDHSKSNGSNAFNIKALALKNIGDLQRQQAEYTNALASYQDALTTYNQAIALAKGSFLVSVDKIDEWKATGKIIAIPAHNMLSNKGDLLTSLGNLLVKLSRNEEAVKAFKDAIDTFDQVLSQGLHRDALNNKGLALRGLGRLLIELCQDEKALEAYQNALSGYEQILSHAPEDIYALDNKGFLLDSLGDLQTKMSQYPEALQSYQQAVTIYNQILSLAPNYTTSINHKGSVLSSLGDLQIQLSQYAKASQSYQEAIETFDQALAIAPNHIYALKNKEFALMQLGHSKALRNLYTESLQCYYQAIHIHNRIFMGFVNDADELKYRGQLFHFMGFSQNKLLQASEALASYKRGIIAYEFLLSQETDIRILVSYCQALEEQADIYFRLSQPSESLATYEQVIKICDQILSLQSNSYSNVTTNILESKGTTLLKIVGIQEELLHFLRASQSCEQAINVFDQILDLTIKQSRRISTLEIKRACQLLLGKLYCQLAKNEEALQIIQQLVITCDQILNYDPTSNIALKTHAFSLHDYGELQLQQSQKNHNFVEAYNNKGFALIVLGSLQESLSRDHEALTSYKQAVRIYNQALKIDQEEPRTYINKGKALKGLGDLQVKLFQAHDALQSYRDSIRLFDKVLSHMPEFIDAYYNKGNSLKNLGELQSQLLQYTEASQSYEKCIAAYDQTLKVAPNDVKVLNNKGLVLKDLGILQVKLSLYQEALQSYQQSIVTFDHILGLTPDSAIANYSKGFVFHMVGELETKRHNLQEALEKYTQAIAAYEQTLNIVPNKTDALNNKGLALRNLGSLTLELSSQLGDPLHSLLRRGEAFDYYQQAIATYERALELEPENGMFINNKATTLRHLGDLFSNYLPTSNQAIESYNVAAKLSSQAIQHTPKFKSAYLNKAISLYNLGVLQMQLSWHPAAQLSLESALEEFLHVLEIDPNDDYARSHTSYLQILLNDSNDRIK